MEQSRENWYCFTLSTYVNKCRHGMSHRGRSFVLFFVRCCINMLATRLLVVVWKTQRWKVQVLHLATHLSVRLQFIWVSLPWCISEMENISYVCMCRWLLCKHQWCDTQTWHAICLYRWGDPVLKLTEFTHLTMQLFHIPECNIQNRNVHISVLNVALWDLWDWTNGIIKGIIIKLSTNGISRQ